MLVVFTLMFATALYLVERGEERTFVDGSTVRVFDDGSVSELDSVFAASWVILVTYVWWMYQCAVPGCLYSLVVACLVLTE